MDYQINNLMGLSFKSKSNKINDIVSLKGLSCTYKVIDGNPTVGSILTVKGVINNELLVTVTENVTERDVDYVF